jgi:xanthine dehydrogenase accessory factor
MYEIAEQVEQWLAAGRQVHLAQVVATQGFSSRDPGAVLAWTDDGQTAGALFPRIDADLPLTGDRLAGHLAELTVSDAEAVAAGLSCGGVATVLVQNAAVLPAELWSRLRRREPVCLLSELVADAPARTELFTPATIRSAVQVPGAADVPRLFARGTSGAALLTEGDTPLAVVALWPPTTLVVVGDGAIARALAGAAALLDWTAQLTDDALTTAELAAGLTESDAVVVLSHDREVDVPALAAVLSGRAGYVGALGSRGTQAARREGLLARGITEQQLTRIHGPAGLDIDAHTPGEIAVSIVAEVLAARSGSSGGSISERGGPVHTAGVHAPPPRY